MLIPAARDIKPRRKPKTITKAQTDLMNATAAHQAQEYGTEDLAYMPSQLVQCTFPHDDPGMVPAWSRSTPWLTVTFQPGYRVDPKTRQPECIGYPFGTVPRLLMFYVMTEAERMKNRPELTAEEKRTIYLGRSLNKFMLNIGMNPDNGAGKRSDKKRLKSQVERFMRVRINFDQVHASGNGYAFADTLISERGEFWWTAKHNDQEDLESPRPLVPLPFWLSPFGAAGEPASPTASRCPLAAPPTTNNLKTPHPSSSPHRTAAPPS